MAEVCESDGEAHLAALLRSPQFTDCAVCSLQSCVHRLWTDEGRIHESLNRPTAHLLVGVVELLI